ECGAATPAELDIAAYLWTELDAWARDLLLDAAMRLPGAEAPGQAHAIPLKRNSVLVRVFEWLRF
ncbi:hypothetical protein ACWEQ8_44165, partial [Streptomyces noursei]